MSKFHKISFLLFKKAMSLSDAAKIFDLKEQDFMNLNDGQRSELKEKVRKTFKRLAREFHPDLNPGGEDKTKDLTVARSVLMDALEGQLRQKQEQPVDPMDIAEIFNPNNKWEHPYWTPAENMNEADRWRYYTDPDIYRQNVKDFEEEQYYAQEDYERAQEEKEEADRDNAYNAISKINDSLYEVDVDTLLLAFGKDLDFKLAMLDLNKDNFDYKRYTKFSNLSNEIDAAIYERIKDMAEEGNTNPMFRLMSLPSFNDKAGNIGDYFRFWKGPIYYISTPELCSLLKNNKLDEYDERLVVVSLLGEKSVEEFKYILNNCASKVIELINKSPTDTLHWVKDWGSEKMAIMREFIHNATRQGLIDPKIIENYGKRVNHGYGWLA